MAEKVSGISLDTTRVDKMLNAMLASTSPASMGAFLGTVAFQHFSRRAAARFETEGDDASGTWQPLNLTTIEVRESLGFSAPHKINVRTGHLRDSVVHGKPGVTHLGIGAMLTFPEKWDRPDLFWRNMQAAGEINTREARPVVGLAYDNDVAKLLAALTAWIVTGKGQNN